MSETQLNRWVPLTTAQRWELLDRSRAVHIELGTKNRLPPDRPPGLVFDLLGRGVDDLPGFFCALGEAINGPGGYFGRSLRSLRDCSVGGFGATTPFALRWHNVNVAQEALSRGLLVQWARSRLANADYLDVDEQRWLIGVEHLAERDEGPTLFEHIVSTLEDLEVSLEFPVSQLP
jgi:hypothetical protein